MSSLGIFDKETNTYKKVADLSKTAVIDSSMSDTSTNPVQNKVVKSYVDGAFKRKLIAQMHADGKTQYCQLCTIKIINHYINTPIEITVQERGRTAVDRLTVLFDSINNIDPNLISFKVFGEFDEWYISKRAASTWVIYGTKNEPLGGIGVVDYIEYDGINVTWDVTGVTSLPDSKTKAVWGGNVSHAVSADSASSASTVTNADAAMSDTSTNAVQNKVIKSYVDNGLNTLKKSVSDGKTTVANAITAKGVTTATDATFATMANNISQITTGVDTSDATATADQILTGQTAYVNGNKVTGTLGTKTTSFTRRTPTGLSASRSSLAGASVKGFALFAGGTSNGNDSSTVDAYNSSLTRSTPTGLSVSRRNLAGASVKGFALFAGGDQGIYSSAVDAYNSSLVRSTPTELSVSRYDLAGASVGNYALFAGGSQGSGTIKPTVDAYNSSLVRRNLSPLSVSRYDLAGASVGNYALFAGGANNNYSSAVDVYNSSLAKGTLSSLSVSRSSLAGASVGNYALFAGGANNNNSSAVDAYNSSLTRSTPTGLSTERSHLAGASVGNYALFAGGAYNSGTYSTVDAYNSSLVRSTPTELSTEKSFLAGASVKGFALFAGGTSNGNDSSAVDAYEQPYVNIPSRKIYV